MTAASQPGLEPFFVVGSDRSGTTMLQLMLNEHPSLHVPKESWFLIDLMNELPLTSPLSESDVRSAFEIVTNHFRWKDWEIDRLHEVFPRARFVHIIRDGRDVCLSTMIWQFRASGLRSNAKIWADCVAAGMESGQRLPEGLYLQFAYEDLVADTEGTLRRVCEFLGVPYAPAMLDFHENAEKNISTWQQTFHHKTMRSPRADDVQRWKGVMGTVDLLMFEALAGRTMDKANQVRRFRGAWRLLTSAFSLADRLAGAAATWARPLLAGVGLDAAPLLRWYDERRVERYARRLYRGEAGES